MIKNLCRKRNYENKKNYLDTKKSFLFYSFESKKGSDISLSLCMRYNAKLCLL